jgi:hypothetical protein
MFNTESYCALAALKVKPAPVWKERVGFGFTVGESPPQAAKKASARTVKASRMLLNFMI